MTRSRRLLDEADGIDAIVIVNSREPFLDPTFWYATGAMGGLFESSIAVVNDDGVQAIVSSMEADSAREGDASVTVYESVQQRDDLLSEAVGGAKSIGINSPCITHSSVEHLRNVLKQADFKDASAAISRARSIKDADEVANMARAAEIASRVASELPDILQRGMTEQYAAARIDSRLREEGSEGSPFSTIVAFGSNAAHPHHRPGDRQLRDGMVALCDFGAIHRRYCSDISRTLFCGKPDTDAVKAYGAVAEAQEKGFEAMVDGAKASEPDRAAREVLDAAGLKELFIHSFGHEIGLSVHEGGVMSTRSQQTLRSGMVMSAEPGVYVPGRFGIRIEDTVHISSRGPKRLTDCDRSLTVI